MAHFHFNWFGEGIFVASGLPYTVPTEVISKLTPRKLQIFYLLLKRGILIACTWCIEILSYSHFLRCQLTFPEHCIWHVQSALIASLAHTTPLVLIKVLRIRGQFMQMRLLCDVWDLGLSVRASMRSHGSQCHALTWKCHFCKNCQFLELIHDSWCHAGNRCPDWSWSWLISRKSME